MEWLQVYTDTTRKNNLLWWGKSTHDLKIGQEAFFFFFLSKMILDDYLSENTGL